MNRSFVILGACALLATPSIVSAQQQAAPPAPPPKGPELAVSVEAAQAAVDACSKDGFKVAAAVVNQAGGLKVFLAADGASTGAIESSVKKATTSIKLK